MPYLRSIFTFLIISFFIHNSQAQDLISIEFKGERTQAELVQDYGLLMQNGVALWKVSYTTPDVFNQLDTASGLLVVPLREETTIYPLLVYQHGTVDGPQDVPSNLQGGYQLAELFGGLGYASLAPDYLGAGEARGFHPYVHRESEASAAVDMIRAVRTYAPEIDLLLNNQLFVTGYSQGGHASMALHQALELEHADEIELTAASHLSGPYSISGVMRDVILRDEPYNFLAYLPNTYLSYNYVYGIYDDIEQIFKPAYTTAIRNFYEGNIGLGNLNNFLISTVTQEHGAPIARYMLQDSIIAILEDPAASDHPLVQALEDNDTYKWAPQRPTRIFYCMADDQVYFRNSVVADSVMQELGAVDLVTTDVNSDADHGGCVEPAVINTALFFSGFADWTVNTREQNSIPVRIFPNPAQDWLQFEGLEADATVRLLNQQGALVWQEQLPFGETRLNLPLLPTGVYWLRIQTENGQAVRKIILDRD